MMKRQRQTSLRMTDERGSIRTALLLALALCLTSEWFVQAATPLQQQNHHHHQQQNHHQERSLQETVQGLQSHFGANSFAGGMVIPSTNPNVAYITGQVGAYNCFIGAVSLTNNDKTLRFLSKQILEGAICQNLSLNSKESQLLLLATAEEGGLFTETRQTGTTRATQYGLIAPLLFAADGAQAILQPGLLLHDDPVQYPKALVMDPFHDDFAYLVSMHSDSKEENTHTTIDSEPNFTYLRKYGSSYFITIRRILFNDKKILPNRAWSKEYAVTPQNSVEANVVVSNMIYSKGNLLLVGYTEGSGTAFGNDVGSGISGFVSKFDTETGNIQDTPARVSLGTASNTFTLLYDVCAESKDAEYIYITAFTSEKEIILIKMHAELLDIEWQAPLTTNQDVHDLMCAVDPSSEVVYMAGVVADGGTVSHTTSSTISLGRDDVFVTQISADSGAVNWLRQLGTTKDDRVASIHVLTEQGGLLMFGDSSGSLLASASKNSEVWIAQIPWDGSLPTTTEVSSQVSNDGGNVPIGQPVYDDGDQIIPPDDSTNDPPNVPNTPPDGGGGGDNNNGGGGDTPPPLYNHSNDDDGKGNYDMLRPYGISAIIVLIIFTIGMIIIRRKQIQQEKVTERALVFSYLQAFEPEDIDVRNSATGGWHGTYVGKVHKDGAATHSSVVKDNTFVDYDLGSPVPPTREPRRKFVIGDDDEDGDMELDDHADDERRNRYKTDDDYENETNQREMDAVDIRIGRVGSCYEDEESKPAWGKDIV